MTRNKQNKAIEVLFVRTFEGPFSYPNH